MNLEQVSHYISHPSELTSNEAPALKDLSEKYPYAAIFSLLYLTSLSNGKSVDLDSALPQHAYRLSDRTQLYHLIHSTVRVADEKTPIKETENEPTIEIPQPFIVQPNELVVDTSQPEEEIIQHEEEPTADSRIEISETAETSSEYEDFEHFTNAFTVEQQVDLSLGENSPSDQEKTEEEVVETTPLEITSEPKAQDSIDHTSSDSKEIIQSSEKRSFTSWLKSARAIETPKNDVPIAEKRKVDEIIEHFIKEEPTITRGKTEFFSPPKKAKESLDEDTIPVSETLAKIYAAQGNYPKAIHVYHQLMLAFPEKKLLFAVRIDELKKKITS